MSGTVDCVLLAVVLAASYRMDSFDETIKTFARKQRHHIASSRRGFARIREHGECTTRRQLEF